MRISRWGGAAALGAAVGLALAAPAQADHAAPELSAGAPGDCGTMTISTGDWAADTHQVATTVLVVQAAGEQQTVAVGDSITLGPFDTAEVTVRWRVWGGGERDYDSPPLDDLAALVAYLEAYPGGELDADPPGVAWHELTVEGCEPAPSPSPTVEPTTAPTTKPTPGPGPTDDPAAPGQGGEKPGLPVTGSPLPMLGGVGAGALALGGGLWWLARRRRAVSFTA